MSRQKAILISTRDDTSPKVSFKDAILNPSAPKGGLYTFSQLPKIQSISEFLSLSYEELSIKLFDLLCLDIEPTLLKDCLSSYKAFDNTNNPAPLIPIDSKLAMLNLYSGPTRAFKDMALQPFGALLSHYAAQSETKHMILAATSGDTGPATLQSFANKPYIKVVCLYPYKGTSDVQRLQMTTQNAKNCKVIGIKGNFDDAQSALKSLLASASFTQALKERGIALSAANSLNIGRIAFQIIYHFWAYIQACKSGFISQGEKLPIVVPSGNFGNILGAFFAKKMGLPLGHLVVASNINNVLSDFINTGVYDISSRHLLTSQSPAMDILKSSNVERMLFALFGAKETSAFMHSLEHNGKYQLSKAQLEIVQADFKALYCNDTQCLESIAYGAKHALILDPHSAIAYYGARKLIGDSLIDKAVFLATAEWSKFAPSVWNALVQGGLVKETCTDDKQAIARLCAYAGLTPPVQIQALFEKAQIQQDVISPSDIPSHILQWLESGD